MARKQDGQIVKISGRWYVRYWERRTINGAIERKRVSHLLGPVMTRGKYVPEDIKNEAAKHMATINYGSMVPDRIVTVGDFVERVYLPWIEKHKRPATVHGYRHIWENHLKPISASTWLKETRTYNVQAWLNQIGANNLGRNTLKHIKSTISGIFTLAKQQDYFQGENPARDTAINPTAKEPSETYAYSLEEIQSILSALPEPAATAFAVAAYAGLRHGEIQGLLWENYRNGELFVSRSIWNGRANDPKTRKSRAPVPVIPMLAQRLDMHRLRCGEPQEGPIFANLSNKPASLVDMVNRQILPALNVCEKCHKPEADHYKADHGYKRDVGRPEWHGWHAARRGLGSNLYRLGVTDMMVQRILRHDNVATTTTYYIKTATPDVRDAMEKLQNAVGSVRDTYGTPEEKTILM
jgi:integrase